MLRTRGFKNQQFNILILILSSAIVAYIAFPFATVLSFIEPTTLLESLARPHVSNAFILSLISSTISTLFLILFGMPLAYCLARYNFKGKILLQTIVILPLVLPPLASGALLLGIFSPSAYIGEHFSSIEFTQSLIGIIIAQTYVASPFMILASQASFESVDKSYEMVARVLGKSKIETFIRITLPLSKSGLVISILLTWVRTIGELGATMMVSYNPHTISIQIFEDNAIGGLHQAMPDIILVIILSIFALIIVSIIKKKDTNSFKITKWA